MTSTLIIKPGGVGNFEWLQLDGITSTVIVGDIERLAEAVLATENCLCVIPGENTAFRQVAYDNGERKILNQTIPYTLEDDLIEDVEGLHFALGTPKENIVSVAIISRDDIDYWLAPFKQEQIDLKQLISELFLIPREELSWSLLIDGDRWTLRSSSNQGISVSAQTANMALQLLLDESEQLPEKISVYGAGQSQAEVMNKLPELLRGIVQWCDDDYWTMVAKAYCGINSSIDDSQSESIHQTFDKFAPINFLQGQYARNLPWHKWWKTWRVAAVLLVGAVMTGLLSSYIKVSTLEQKNVDLRREIENVYRTVVPKGAIIDAERQLRRKVNSVKGTGGEDFVSLLNQIGTVLVQTDGLTLHSLNYTGSQSEVRMTVIANDFVDVEKTRLRLEKTGLTAVLTGSSSEGTKTRARLKIKG